VVRQDLDNGRRGARRREAGAPVDVELTHLLRQLWLYYRGHWVVMMVRQSEMCGRCVCEGGSPRESERVLRGFAWRLPCLLPHGEAMIRQWLNFATTLGASWALST
jgi:hypothetical protein